MSNGDNVIRIAKDEDQIDRELAEWTESINFHVNKAVEQVIRDFLPTLDYYLEALDKGEFECMCTGDVFIKFHPDHTVTANIPMRVMEGYTWAFKKPIIEVEIDGTFESHLS